MGERRIYVIFQPAANKQKRKMKILFKALEEIAQSETYMMKIEIGEAWEGSWMTN